MTISFIISFDWLTVRVGEYWKNGPIGLIGYPNWHFLSHRTFASLPLFVESRSIRLSLEETPISVQKKAGCLRNN